jgi:CRP-like cAMP-binding protein
MESSPGKSEGIQPVFKRSEKSIINNSGKEDFKRLDVGTVSHKHKSVKIDLTNLKEFRRNSNMKSSLKSFHNKNYFMEKFKPMNSMKIEQDKKLKTTSFKKKNLLLNHNSITGTQKLQLEKNFQSPELSGGLKRSSTIVIDFPKEINEENEEEDRKDDMDYKKEDIKKTEKSLNKTINPERSILNRTIISERPVTNILSGYASYISKKTSKRLEDREDYLQIITANKSKLDSIESILFADREKKKEIIEHIKDSGNFDTRNIKVPFYIILPSSKYKRFWDIFVLLFLIYCLFVIPIDIAWNIECFSVDNGAAVKTTYTVCYIIFFLDILINFFTAVINEKKQYIYDLKCIFKTYVSTRFAFDVLAALPFDKFKPFNMNDCFKLHIADSKIYLMLNLLRIFKLSYYIKIVEDKLHRYINIIRFFKIFISLLYLAHFLGNLFAGYSSSAKQAIFSDCEIYNNLTQYKSCLQTALRDKFPQIYSYSLFIGLMFLVLNEYNNNYIWERIFAIIIIITAIFLNASIFANVALIIQKMSISLPPIIQERIDIMREYMTFMKFESSFINTIEEYHINIFRKERNMLYKPDFFNNISTSLHKQILIQQWRNSFFIINHMLPNISLSFFSNMIPLLKPRIYMHNDTIVTEGENNTDIYFISKTGLCSLSIGGEWIKNLTMGDYFGEVSIFLRSRRRTATIKSIKDSDFLCIEGDSFEKLLQDFPEDCNQLKNLAKNKLLTNIKLYPSKLFAKLVPKNDIGDYLLRRSMYLNDKEEDEIIESRNKGASINLETVEPVLKQCTDFLSQTKDKLLKIKNL